MTDGMDLKAMMANPEFAKMIQARMNDMMGQNSGLAREHFESLPEEVKLRVEVLRELEETRQGYDEEYNEELKALEKKYREKFAPLFERRQKIVSGEEEVEGASGDVKGIPEFWGVAMRNCPEVGASMGEKDEEVLKYLTNLTEAPLEDEEGFVLTFTFAENPFFSNTTLTKTYIMDEEDDEMLRACKGTEIQWHSGKDVTNKTMKKKNKKGKDIFKTEKLDSFFHFFSPPPIPAPGDEDDMDEEELQELQTTLESDYELGTHLRDVLIPSAVEWFTGDALEDEDDEDNDDDDDDDEDDDDEDGDDEDDDDDDDDAPKMKGKKKGGEEEAPECKQQ